MSSQEFFPTMEESMPELEEIQNVSPNSFSPTNQPKAEDIPEDEEYSNSAIVEALNNGEEEEENPNPNPNPYNQEDFECLDCHAKLECPNCHANHFNKNQDIPNVPGFRFNPLDYELIVYYLKKKVRNEPLPHNKIREVELYKSNPDDLTENYPGIGEKQQWYFFTPRDRKYKNGTRPNRAAGSGYWKATGADKPVYYMGVPVGHRKALVFYHGKAPKGDKTNWIMHEYRVDEPPRSRTSDNDMRLDDWVLCRIYKKDHKIIKAPKHNEGSDPHGSSIPPLSVGSSPITTTETDLGENPNPNDYNCNGIDSKDLANSYVNYSQTPIQNGIDSKDLANSYVNYSQTPIQNGIGAIPPYDTFNHHPQPNFSFSVQPLTVRHPVFQYQSVFPSKYEPEDWALPNLDSIDPALQFDMLSTNYIDPMLNFDNVLPNNGAQTNVKYHHQQMDS